VVEALLAAIRDGVTLPATGTAHGHVRLADGRLARIAYAYEDDPTAAARLQVQAEGFRHLQPAGRTPRLHEVVEPRPGLPGGALIVDYIEGHAPHLPGELDALAETLAAIHSLPLPADGSPIPRQKNPFVATLDGIELNTALFLDKAVPDPESRVEIAEELALMRGLARQVGERAQPLTMALADTHPGNFIVDRAGIAWFVDLEKVHVGSAAIDLAHVTLPTSTLWASAEGRSLSSDEVQGFYAAYLDRIGTEAANALKPWLVPMRRLTWLRTTLFMARWRVETRSARDLSNASQWSDAGLDDRMKDHIDAHIDHCFRRDSIRDIRGEWRS
jgi:aminoglycoside phosphotransferase (APT) family kinase protein